MRTHTPGPWNIYSSNPIKRIEIGVSDGREIAIIQSARAHSSVKSPEERVANAQLIVAAPELLRTLKIIAELAKSDQPVRWNGLITDGHIETVKELIFRMIAKAEGSGK